MVVLTLTLKLNFCYLKYWNKIKYLNIIFFSASCQANNLIISTKNNTDLNQNVISIE